MPHQLCALAQLLFFFVAKLSCSDVKLMSWGEYGFYGQWPPSSRCSACYGTFSGWVGSGQDLNERSGIWCLSWKGLWTSQEIWKKTVEAWPFFLGSQTRLREKQLQYTSKFMKFLFEKGTVGTCVCFRFRSLWKDRCFFLNQSLDHPFWRTLLKGRGVVLFVGHFQPKKTKQLAFPKKHRVCFVLSLGWFKLHSLKLT